MRFIPAYFAAAVGLLAATSAVLLDALSAHARLLPGTPGYRVGDRKTETREVSADCRGIALNTADNVVVVQGDKAGLTITGPAEEVARTETVVEKGRLQIRKTGKGKMSWGKDDVVTITVTLPAIESVSVSGSGDLKSEGTLTGADLAVTIAGSGDVHLTAEMTGAISTKLAGSGDVRLGGRCATHTVTVAGSGDVRADDLRAATAAVKISGSGDVSVAAADALDVRISGSGSVRYAGNPSRITKSVTGSGSVAKL